MMKGLRSTINARVSELRQGLTARDDAPAVRITPVADASAISAQTLVRDVVARGPRLVDVLRAAGMSDAEVAGAITDTIASVARIHGQDSTRLVEALNAAVRGEPPPVPIAALPGLQAAPATARRAERPPPAAPKAGAAGIGRPLPMMRKATPRPAVSSSGGANIKHIVAVMSGKGGVGKSLVAGLLAVALRRQGLAVGILDGDITGPSIPRMFGLAPGAMQQTRENEPPYSKSGIAIMSMNVLLEQEDQAVVWRGPMVANAIKEFYTNIAWGELDYLLVDLPPGTSDAPMTVLQALPVDGAIIVSTPQKLAAMVVRKAIRMCEKLETPVLGLVENMAYITLPDGGRYEPFGTSQGQLLAAESGAPLLAQLPIDQRIATLCDTGMIEAYDSAQFAELSANFLKVVQGVSHTSTPLRVR